MEIKDTVHKTNKISQMYRLISVINLRYQLKEETKTVVTKYHFFV